MSEQRDTEKLESVKPSQIRLGRSLVLVGLMGAGKTAVGRRVAQRLAVPFIDSDAEIEKAADSTVSEIFARDGEAAFRAGERRVIARLLEGPICVLATGGGAFMNDETRERLRQQSIVVWLKADLDTLVARTARRNTRPLLSEGEPRDVLSRLMDLRHPKYSEAHLTIESLAGPVENTVQALWDKLSQYAAPDGLVSAVGIKGVQEDE